MMTFESVCLVFSSGNPGLIGYYEHFVRSLYDELLGEYVIWGLGHAGHDFPIDVILPSVNGNFCFLVNSFHII